MTRPDDPSPEPATDARTSRPTLLVGDADRARTQDRLSHAVGLGELSLDEFDDRVQAALRARTEPDLRLLLADLPSAAGALALAPASWTPPAVPSVSPSTQVFTGRESSAEPWTSGRRRPGTGSPSAGPVQAWARWAVLAALMIAIWLAVGVPTGAWYPWPIWPILGTAVCAVRQSVEQRRIGGAGVGV